MRHFLDYQNITKANLQELFSLADEIDQKQNICAGKTFILFFPETSIRTRVSFEKGINMLGGQTIVFPSETLDKKEKIKDVSGYLNNWADCLVIRHPNKQLLEEVSRYSEVPVINAMTAVDHPCEILTDLYALKQLGRDIFTQAFLFVGANENIGYSWYEAAKTFGLSFTQTSPKSFQITDANHEVDIHKAIKGKDIILTDSWASSNVAALAPYQVTTELMEQANPNALLNPCPPFTRGEEVSEEVIASEYFVGYGFKNSLLNVQQAILLWCLENDY